MSTLKAERERPDDEMAPFPDSGRNQWTRPAGLRFLLHLSETPRARFHWASTAEATDLGIVVPVVDTRSVSLIGSVSSLQVPHCELLPDRTNIKADNNIPQCNFFERY